MRGLFWTTIPAREAENTIWKGLSDANISLDFADIEAKFGVPNNSKTVVPVVSVSQFVALKNNITRFVQALSVYFENYRLLDTSKANNIEIALSRFKMSIPEIQYIIYNYFLFILVRQY